MADDNADAQQDIKIQEQGKVVDPNATPVVDAPEPEKVQSGVVDPNIDHTSDRYYGGTWSGYPNYKCPVEGCGFATLQGSWAVDEHIYDWHPEESGLDFGEERQGH